MATPEKPNFKLLIGGRSSTLAPASYRPDLYWNRKTLKKLEEDAKTRAMEKLKINSGLNIKPTKPPQPDPDSAA